MNETTNGVQRNKKFSVPVETFFSSSSMRQWRNDECLHLLHCSLTVSLFSLFPQALVRMADLPFAPSPQKDAEIRKQKLK